jgi:hypothetical protein
MAPGGSPESGVGTAAASVWCSPEPDRVCGGAASAGFETAFGRPGTKKVSLRVCDEDGCTTRTVRLVVRSAITVEGFIGTKRGHVDFTGEPFHVYTLVGRDGKRYWLDVNGFPHKVDGFLPEEIRRAPRVAVTGIPREYGGIAVSDLQVKEVER